MKKLDKPRSYNVRKDNGNVVRRTMQHLRPSANVSLNVSNYVTQNVSNCKPAMSCEEKVEVLVSDLNRNYLNVSHCNSEVLSTEFEDSTPNVSNCNPNMSSRKADKISPSVSKPEECTGRTSLNEPQCVQFEPNDVEYSEYRLLVPEWLYKENNKSRFGRQYKKPAMLDL